VDDALKAATALQPQGIATVLTQLGENISDPREADAVREHYLDVLAKIAATSLNCQISVKPTQLALDIDKSRCVDNLRALAERALAHKNFVWIDMEQHRYVDATLDLYTRVLADFPNVGVCLQAYLYRTPKDLAALLPLGGGVRLVKGAYKEPESVAYPQKKDVDAAYVDLAKQMIGPVAQKSGFRAIYGTHDQTIIRTIQQHAASTGVPKDGFEYDLLYGIQRDEQQQLARDGFRIRVLISYGEFWFPWYMRRLAERPANVWFVAKSVFSS
jgi:proline dehydrogenase